MASGPPRWGARASTAASAPAEHTPIMPWITSLALLSPRTTCHVPSWDTAESESRLMLALRQGKAVASGATSVGAPLTRWLRPRYQLAAAGGREGGGQRIGPAAHPPVPPAVAWGPAARAPRSARPAPAPPQLTPT